jgi:tol-pal system protein YbgF
MTYMGRKMLNYSKQLLIYSIAGFFCLFLTGCLATTGDMDAMKSGLKEQQKELTEVRNSYEKFNKTVQQNQAKLKSDLDQENNDQKVMAEKLDGIKDEISRLSQRMDDLEIKITRTGTTSSAGSPGVISAAIVSPPVLSEAATATGTASLPSLTTVSKAEVVLPGKVVSPSDLYQAAYNDYMSRNYDLAIQGFSDYLKKYAQTELSPSAQYWIGECYYSKAEFDKATREFDKVAKLYPRSAKVPAAKLKSAFSLYELNKKNEAAQLLEEIIDEYPSSSIEVQLARERLEIINQDKKKSR